MPLCTECGYILHEDDVREHVCNEVDKPTKGRPRKPTTVEVVRT